MYMVVYYQNIKRVSNKSEWLEVVINKMQPPPMKTKNGRPSTKRIKEQMT